MTREDRPTSTYSAAGLARELGQSWAQTLTLNNTLNPYGPPGVARVARVADVLSDFYFFT